MDMTKQQLFALLFVGLVTIGAVAFIMARPTSPSVTITDSEEARFANATIVQYVDGEGQSVSVSYVGDLARVTGGTYDGVTLRQVASASGAKYEGETGVTLWTKNNEMRIETPQALVYQGTAIETPDTAATPIVPDMPDAVVTEEAGVTTSTSTVGSLPAGIFDTTWVWVDAVLVNDETVTPNKSQAFSLTLTSGGQAQGVTDCNGFGGNYTVSDDGVISFGEFASTLMFCDGSQEEVFRNLLLSGVTIEDVTESALVLKNQAGDILNFSTKNN